MTAKEPYNYFLLLRALFRSIGGGSHDLLYQEFLPLLPTLLQGEIVFQELTRHESHPTLRIFFIRFRRSKLSAVWSTQTAHERSVC